MCDLGRVGESYEGKGGEALGVIAKLRLQVRSNKPHQPPSGADCFDNGEATQIIQRYLARQPSRQDRQVQAR